MSWLSKQIKSVEKIVKDPSTVLENPGTWLGGIGGGILGGPVGAQIGAGVGYNATSNSAPPLQQLDPNVNPTYDEVYRELRAYNMVYNGFLTDDDLRNITSQLAPNATKDNYKDLVGAIVANRYTDYKKNPTATPDQQTQASDIFRSTMGRDPTQEEIDFFSKELAGGTSSYELGQFLKTTPEYMQQQSTLQEEKYKTEAEAARNALSTQMLAQEEEAFKRATPQILAEYMRTGRINSSGLVAAIANARADLSKNRENYMAQLAYQDAVRGQGYNREDYLAGQGRAYEQYLRQNQPSYAAQSWQMMNAAQLPYQQAQSNQARAQQIQDYYRQQNDYNNYLNQMMKAQERSDLWGLAGNLGGSLLGLGTMAFGGK